jgi:phage terminase large subunit-like protein
LPCPCNDPYLDVSDRDRTVSINQNSTDEAEGRVQMVEARIDETQADDRVAQRLRRLDGSGRRATKAGAGEDRTSARARPLAPVDRTAPLSRSVSSTAHRLVIDR